MIQDSQEQQVEGQTPRKCMGKFIQDPRVRGDEQYPHPLLNLLGESPPKEEESQLRRGPAKELAGTPTAAGEMRRRRLGTLGAGGKNCPKGSPTPPLYTQPSSRPDIPAKVSPEYPPPPRIFRPWGRIFRPGAPESKTPQIFKNRSSF
jgi:hypothetical protein